MNSYFYKLESNKKFIQLELETLMKRHQVQSVGSGYIDLIIPHSRVIHFLDDLSNLSICAEYISWWCHCTAENKKLYGCPHGMGGPNNQFGNGYFSECTHLSEFDPRSHGFMLETLSKRAGEFVKECNHMMAVYLENELVNEDFYSPCLTPGLWLYLPPNWNREYFLR